MPKRVRGLRGSNRILIPELAATNGIELVTGNNGVDQTVQLAPTTHIKAVQTSGQSFTNNTETVVTYNSESYDTLGEFVPSTGKFTAKNNGYYHITSSCLFDSAAWVAKSYIEMRVFKNGTVESRGTRVGIETAITDYYGAGISNTLYMNKDDYLELKMIQSSGGTKTTLTSNVWNWICIDRLL